MVLVIGGMGQGKLSYALERLGDVPVADGAVCSIEEAYTKPVLYRFHLLVRRLLAEEKSVETVLADLLQQNPAVTVICDEIGCGIVPMEPFERIYREAVGRSCCALAAGSEQVVRVVCGIGQTIKGAG